MKTVEIKVEGMACGHCEIAVQDAVRKLPGIKKVKANKGKKQAKAEYDETQVTLAQIVDAINATGYEAKAE